MAGAAFGGILGEAYAESMLILGTMGGVLGALVGYSLAIEVKESFPTGREVVLYLNSTSLIEKYIKHKVDRGLKVEGHLHFLSRKEYEQRCFSYVLHRLSEGGELPHGKEGAIKGSNFYEQAREAAKRSPGFQSHGQIYINQETAEAGTVIHESIHLFQELNYYDRMKSNVNEGTTEYFTRLICAEHQITPKIPLTVRVYQEAGFSMRRMRRR